MTVTRSCFDYRNLGILNASIYQSLTASRYKNVNKTSHRHKSVCTLSVGRLDKSNSSLIKITSHKSLLNNFYKRLVCIYSFLTATQYNSITGL